MNHSLYPGCWRQFCSWGWKQRALFMNYALAACFSAAFALSNYWRKLGHNGAVFIEARNVFLSSMTLPAKVTLGVRL